MLLVQFFHAVMGKWATSFLCQRSAGARSDLDVVPSICVPISVHVEARRSTPTPSLILEPDGGNLVNENANARHPRRRVYFQRQLTGGILGGAVTVMMHTAHADREGLRLSKVVAATHLRTMEPMVLNLSLLNADKQTSDKPAKNGLLDVRRLAELPRHVLERKYVSCRQRRAQKSRQILSATTLVECAAVICSAQLSPENKN